MNGITLQQILDAREARAAEQARLLRTYRCPLICFSMNIAGPVKRTPLIERAFALGQRQLRTALQAADARVLYRAECRADTGCEAFYAVDLDAGVLKALCVSVEEAAPVGRLFDMDVLDADGRKLERGTQRPCLVCGAPGRGCASRRLHSVAALQAATEQLLRGQFLRTDAETVSALVTDALIEEVETTPKPGLVDRNNNGSHTDMTVALFRTSAEALRGYWAKCFSLGVQAAACPPETAFAALREAGRNAESAMYRATGGVNTHKGAIYAFGVICGAVGRLWKPEAPFAGADAILDVCAELTRDAAAADFARARNKPEAERTAGERLYLRYGLTGIRGEAAAGFPSVRGTALPMYRRLLRAGLDRERAGTIALLSLISLGIDTNMVARGGPAAARRAAAQAQALLEAPALPSEEALLALDGAFIAERLSPGGCADLLAVTYFLTALAGEAERAPRTES